MSATTGPQVYLHRPYVGQAFACFNSRLSFLSVRITERRADVDRAKDPIVIFVRVRSHVYGWVGRDVMGTLAIATEMGRVFVTTNVPTRSICIRSLNVEA